MKKPKYDFNKTYIITVTFERLGDKIEELLAKFKTHKYYWIEEKNAE